MALKQRAADVESKRTRRLFQAFLTGAWGLFGALRDS